MTLTIVPKNHFIIQKLQTMLKFFADKQTYTQGKYYMPWSVHVGGIQKNNIWAGLPLWIVG